MATTAKTAAPAAASLAGTPGIELPSGPRSHFKDIFKLIEEKQYKRAVKAADAVLKDVPQHGESLSMKALALLNLNKKEEAMDLARAGLKSHVKSHICWHVYGMIHKQDNNLAEALKAFKNAQQIEPENPQILRDLSLVQLQLRDYRGHHETRRVMLTSKSNIAVNWIGLAVAHQLAGNCELALAVLEQYDGTLEPTRAATYETSEMQLYKVRIMEQMGATEKALSTLDALIAEGKILDTIAIGEKRGQLLLTLKRYDAAQSVFTALLGINNEHFGYHRGLQACILKRGGSFDGAAVSQNYRLDFSGCNAAEIDALTTCYISLHAKFPTSRAVKRIVLDILPASNPLFKPLLAAYLRAGFRKGLPSLFTDLKHLNRTLEESSWPWGSRQAFRKGTGRSVYPTEKSEVLSAIIVDMIEAAAASKPLPQYLPDADAAMNSWKLSGTIETDEAGAYSSRIGPLAAADLQSLMRAAGDESGEEPPSTYPWVLLFAARLSDECGDCDAALKRIDQAIAHTPTIIDLHVAKARLLKHNGSLTAAVETADTARQLDLADRFLNAKAVKYMLRAGLVERANKTMALFSRMDAKESTGDPLGNVKDLQVIWFELEKAQAYQRGGNFGLAIKHYLRIDKHFKEFVEDQYDFHGYSLRKGPLRAYADVLATLDKVFSHTQYLKAMVGLARCYFALALDSNARLGAGRWSANKVLAAFGKGGDFMKEFVMHTAANLESQITDARTAVASIQAATAAKAKSTEDEASSSKEEDLMCDDKCNITNPLEEANKYISIAIQNLPAFKPGSAHVSAAAATAVGAKMPTPTSGGSVTPPSAMPTKKTFAWNADPDLIASCYAVAAEIALARKKLVPAVGYMRCGQAAAAQSHVAASHAALAGGAAIPRHFLHPQIAGASLAVYYALETELINDASVLAPAAPAIKAVLNASDQIPAGAAKLEEALTQLGNTTSIDLLTALLQSRISRALKASFTTLDPASVLFAEMNDGERVSLPTNVPQAAVSVRAHSNFINLLVFAVLHNLCDAGAATTLMKHLKAVVPHLDAVTA